MPNPALTSQPVPGIFPTTRWSVIRRAGAAHLPADEVRVALTQLCRAYWYPLYAYVRRRGHDVHDAQDITQSFVLEIIDGPLLTRADSEKGRFRAYVLRSLENFLANFHRSRGAQRRGGQTQVFSLDEQRDETRLAGEMTEALTPEEHFERAWAFALLEKVLSRVKAEYAAAGRAALFAALEPYLSGSDGQQSYAALGPALGLSENGVAVSIHRLRRRYGEIVREEIAATVDEDENEVEAELSHLFSILSR